MKKSHRTGAAAVQPDRATTTSDVAITVEPVAEVAAKHEVKQVIAKDQFAGKGGNYIFDPATGKRTAA